MASRTVQLGLILALGLVLTGCQPGTTSVTPTSGSSPSAFPVQPAILPAQDLEFPSRNGTVELPDSLNLATLRADFVQDGQTVTGDLVRKDGRLTLRKPLAAPQTGQIVFSDDTRKLGTVAYRTTSASIDVAINVPNESFPFRVEPAEKNASATSRTVRVQPGSTLKIVIPEGNTVLGEVAIDDNGQVGSINGLIAGSEASLRLDLLPIQLDMLDIQAPVRLGPFETNFVAGSRLVWLPPGISTFLAIGAENFRIEGITIGSDGTVSQSQGLVKTKKRTLTPVTRTYRFDAGAYAGTWRLRRYETTFSLGSRDIAVLAADRQFTINFGNLATESPEFDPEITNSVTTKTESTLKFNLLPAIMDPSELGAPYLVQPFETTFNSGRRTVYLPRFATSGNIALVSGSDIVGPFQTDADGTLKSMTPSLIATNSGLKLNVLPVRVEVAESTRPYRVMPFEVATTAGTRTIPMVRGQAGRVESQGESYAFAISGDGTVSTQDRHLTTLGGSLVIHWNP